MFGRIVPNLYASKIGEIKEGTKVTVIRVLNSWSCIKYDNGKVAWVPSSFLTEIENEESEQEQQPEQEEQSNRIGYINVSAAIIREGPSAEADIITEWRRNKTVEIIGEEGDWYKIAFEEKEAYVAKRLVSDSPVDEASRNGGRGREQLEIDEEEEIENSQETEEVVEENIYVEQAEPQYEEPASSSRGDEVVATAKQYLGCSYVYGGSGPSSFDCSGFTMYIYGKFGVSLAHGAISQSNAGSYVSKEDLELGDLVIFRDWDNTSIGHCGIYIGDGQFIHAANPSRGVVTDTLLSGYYAERYVSGRRLL